MPDYDPKSIPILDDIIEDNEVNPEEKNTGDIDVNDIDQDENTLDLFVTAETDIAITNIDVEAAEPEIGSIDQFINTTDDDTEEIETETVESALIDYHSETVDDRELDIQHEETQQNDIQPSDDIRIDNDIIPVPDQSIALESIVDDVVKQLIPDLEQQLRFLVQQALEEKLPAEILDQLSTGKNDQS